MLLQLLWLNQAHDSPLPEEYSSAAMSCTCTELAAGAKRGITPEWPQREDGFPVLQWGWRWFLVLVLFCVREAEVWLERVINQQEGNPDGTEDKKLHWVGKRQ